MKWRVCCGLTDLHSWVEAETEAEAIAKYRKEFIEWLMVADCFYAHTEDAYKELEAADIEFESRGAYK